MPPTLQSGKHAIKILNGVPVVPVTPKFLFIAIQDRGVVDVFNIGTAEKVRTIDVGGQPAVLAAYWRQ